MSSVDAVKLRYADCPTTEAELRIAATPAAVWRLVCDIELPASFSSEFQGGQWLDGSTEPALGAKFKGRNYHRAVGTWETVSTIYEFEPEREFCWAVGDADMPAARWRFSLTPDGDGTRLRQWMQIGPGQSGISALIEQMPDKESRILYRRLAEHKANMEATLAGIRGLAEDEGRGADQAELADEGDDGGTAATS
jgi:Polyketide cyclase / dehydrase and lipid transport